MLLPTVAARRHRVTRRTADRIAEKRAARIGLRRLLQAAVIALVGVAAVIALRVGLYIAGHADEPILRELARLWN